MTGGLGGFFQFFDQSIDLAFFALVVSDHIITHFMENAQNCHIISILPFRHIILPFKGFSLLHMSYVVFSKLSRVMDIPESFQNIGFLSISGCFPFLSPLLNRFLC